MRVAVYKNIKTKKWSVCSIKVTRNGERKDKLLFAVDELTLEDVSLVIPTQVSFDRVKSQVLDKTTGKSREVIAYAIGTLCTHEDGTLWDADPCDMTDAIKWDHLGTTPDFRNDDGEVISHKTYWRMYFFPHACDYHSVTGSE